MHCSREVNSAITIVIVQNNNFTIATVEYRMYTFSMSCFYRRRHITAVPAAAVKQEL